MLADAINNAYENKAAAVPDINVTMPTISLTAQMPEAGEPTITFAPEIHSPDVVVENVIEQKSNEPDESKDVVKAVRKLARGKN